jgi:UPF0059 membrane protein sked_02440
MSLWSIWLVGLGVSADAFAASLTNGLKMGRFNYRHALAIAFTFAGFQAAMPLLGWLLAANFTSILDPFDHWIAFVLLSIIGGKMAWEAFHAEDEDDARKSRLDLRQLVILGIATSIDAAAVGVSFAMLEVSILEAIFYIGLITFIMSFAAVGIGHRIGVRFRKPAEFLGGLVLVFIGIRILLQGFGVM